jgi:hypothetical protein
MLICYASTREKLRVFRRNYGTETRVSDLWWRTERDFNGFQKPLTASAMAGLWRSSGPAIDMYCLVRSISLHRPLAFRVTITLEQRESELTDNQPARGLRRAEKAREGQSGMPDSSPRSEASGDHRTS